MTRDQIKEKFPHASEAFIRLNASHNCQEMQKRRVASFNSNPRIKLYSRSKKGWVEIGGKRFFSRSSWECNYAKYLEWMKNRGEILDWDHEPHTFWFEEIKRGTRSYLPDFRVTLPGGAIEWHEVKGWMDSKSLTKIRRMAIYHPSEKLIVIDQKKYKALARSLSKIIPGWST